MLALQPTMEALHALLCSLGLSSRPMAVAMGAAMETPTLACLATWRQQAATTMPLQALHLPRAACPCSSRGMASPRPPQVRCASISAASAYHQDFGAAVSSSCSGWPIAMI